MKDSAIIKFEHYYYTIKKILWGYFKKRRVTYQDFEDLYQDIFSWGNYEKGINSFDITKSNGKTEVEWIAFVMGRIISGRLRTERRRKGKLVEIDAHENFEQSRFFDEIKDKVFVFQVDKESIPVFIPDYLISSKIESGLVKIEKRGRGFLEANLIKAHLQYLKRKVWTSKNLVTEKNYQEITQNSFRGMNTPQHYHFSDPMSVIKIKCWVACSKIE